jgi:hypothetical protein
MVAATTTIAEDLLVLGFRIFSTKKKACLVLGKS